MGGKHTTNTAQRIASLQLQSSAYSIPIPRGWGRGRLGLNLFYAPATGFTSQQQSQTQSGGKGGGSVTNVTYTYYADVLFGICDTASGAIRGINAIYRDKSVFSGPGCVAAAGFSGVALGAPGQAEWTYLDSTYPNDALGYDTTAYLYASKYQLNDQAGLQNHSVEVDFALQVGGGIYDANPGDHSGHGIVYDFLTGCIPQWETSEIGDLNSYGTYCLAAGLLLSPVLDTQQQASDFLTELLTCTNSGCWIRGDGTLQIKPLADEDVTGNGVTYTPDLTPLFDLSSSDFIVDNPGDDPVKIDTPNLDDLYNIIQVQFQNRQHQYNNETVSAFDQASIDEIGQRKQDPTTLNSVKDPTTARLIAQLLVQQASSLARPFTFSLPWCFDRLEEMDLVTLSNPAQGLERVLTRIEQIDEDEGSGKFTIKGTEVLVGTAHAPAYPSQTANGVQTNFEADPGHVGTPVLFIAPSVLTNGAQEAWAAVTSTNPNWGGAQVWISISGSQYFPIGMITRGARFGVTKNDFPAHADPDTVDPLTINLEASAGVLLSATQVDVDSAVTLGWLGGELIAYRDAALTGPSIYTLSYLRRGLYNSIIRDHPPGTEFVRLDTYLFKYAFLSAQIGQTLHIKFLSFNIFGNNVQDLADATDYTIVLTAPDQLPGPIASVALQSGWMSSQFSVVCSASPNALSYTFRIYDVGLDSLIHSSNAVNARSFIYTKDMAAADGRILRSYQITVTPTNNSGDGPVSAPLTVSNPAPAAVTGVASSGSGSSVSVNWVANTESDLAGYIAYYSNTSGFDPASGGGAEFYSGTGIVAGLSGLTPGTTYYVRVAAFDTWSDDVTQLNFSAEYSFTA